MIKEGVVLEKAENVTGGKTLQELAGMLRTWSLDLLSKRNPSECFKQGSDINLFLKGHSGSETRRDGDPGKV